MLVLSTDTLERLGRLQVDRDIRDIAHWLYDSFTPYFDRIDADTNRIAKSVYHIYQWASERSLYRNKDLRFLAVMSMSQGIHLNRDPRFSAKLDRAIRQFEMEPNERITHIYATFKTWRNDVIGDAGFDSLMRRAADLIEGYGAPGHLGTSNYEQLQNMLPGQESWLAPGKSNDFFEGVARDLRLRHLPTETHMFSYALLSIVFGYRWIDDPKFETMAKIFNTYLASAPFMQVLCDFLRGDEDNGGH